MRHNYSLEIFYLRFSYSVQIFLALSNMMGKLENMNEQVTEIMKWKDQIDVNFTEILKRQNKTEEKLKELVSDEHHLGWDAVGDELLYSSDAKAVACHLQCHSTYCS